MRANGTISKNAQTSGAWSDLVWGPTLKKIIRFCVVATFVSETQETISFINGLKRLPFISQLFKKTVVLSEIAPVVLFNLRERHRPRVWRQNSSFSSLSHDLSPFTKYFRGGIFCEWSVFLGTLLTAELHWNFKSRVNLTVYQHAVEGNAAGQVHTW